MDSIEVLILKHLIYNDEYLRKVIPFIKKEYFEDVNITILFEEITNFVTKYNSLPTKEILTIEVEKREDLSEESFKQILKIVSKLKEDNSKFDWMVDKTEQWCRDRAIYLAIMQCVEIVDEKGGLSRGAIPQILQDAISVSFDTNVGLDYINDYEKRYEAYLLKEDKIPFDIDLLNLITDGGVSKKTLNIVLGGTGAGKSLVLCHFASSFLLANKNVLYITMEMSENKIAERIDANLLDIPINKLSTVGMSKFEAKIKNLKKKSSGNLIIKEYPTGSAHCGHFRAFLDELKMKKEFIPDVILVDYLNICSSSRHKANSSVGSYTLIKAIAEELRALACEYEVPVFSATQTTRGGYGNTDVDLTDTSESFGLPHTADLMFAIITTEEMESMGQIMIKQLKNRYKEESFHRRFTLGIERSKMRLFNLEESAQEELYDAGMLYNEQDENLPDKKSKFGEWNYG
jgi:replicative DNA helicase